MFRIQLLISFSLKQNVNIQILRNLSKTVQTPPATAAIVPPSAVSQSIPGNSKLPPPSTANQTTTIKEVREVHIPVPWGHISGKWWGPIDRQPMLCVHGWKDNAATFEKLIPLLNVESLLAVDLVGHGRSSPYPIGKLYQYIEEVINIRRIAKYYNWEKFAILAHSFGCTVATAYAAYFPESVSMLIQLDCSRGKLAINDTFAPRVWKNILENNLAVEKRMIDGHIESYAYNDIVKLFAVGNRNDITIESSEVILERGMARAENDKYFLTSDPRLRMGYIGFPNEDWLLAYAAGIKCEVLAITASEGVVMRTEREGERIYFSALEEMEKVATRFEHHHVEGKHYVHLDAAKDVAKIINRFLTNRNESAEKNDTAEEKL